MLVGTKSELAAEPIASTVMEATLPLPVSAKWVAHACRMAAIGKPRWDRPTARWTAIGQDLTETVVVRQGATPNNVVIELTAPESHDSETGHRLITALFTGMQWAVRQRAV